MFGKSLANELVFEHPELFMLFVKCSLEKQMLLMLQMKKDRKKLMNEGVIMTNTLLESPEVEGDPPAFEEETFAHEVRVTEFDDEPFCFFVHFTYNDVALQSQHFKNRLKSEENVVTGTVVIAEIAGQLRYATVVKSTGIVSRDEVKLKLMTGHNCVVSRSQVFKVPDNISNVPYAKRYKLSGVDELKSEGYNVSDMEFFFKQITNQKLLTLKIVKENSNIVIPSCHLFLEEISVLELCKLYDPHMLRYPAQKFFSTNTVEVIVSSIESPTKFFVQPVGATESVQYKAIEETLKHYEPPILRNPKPSNACVVKQGNNYKRAIICGKSTGTIFKIRFVDLGLVEEVNANEIKVSMNDLLTLPPLALRCCLSDFEDKEISEFSCIKFRRICKYLRTVKMKMVGRKAEYLIVELEDPFYNTKINDQLQDPDELNLSDWSEVQPSIDTYSRQRELEGIENDDWDAIEDDLTYSTGKQNINKTFQFVHSQYIF